MTEHAIEALEWRRELLEKERRDLEGEAESLKRSVERNSHGHAVIAQQIADVEAALQVLRTDAEL